MNKITDAAGLPRFTFHALRHTFATRMLEANVSAKIVQDVLGHADVTLTLNTYSHVMGTTAHEHMSKIDGLFQLGKDSEENATEKPIEAPITKSQKNKSIKEQLSEAKKEVAILNAERSLEKFQKREKNNFNPEL